MLITLNNAENSENFAGYRLWTAEQIIWNYDLHEAEKRIEKLVWNEYKLTLKEACLKIIHACKITCYKGDVTITLSDKKLDRLYRLITYGNGKVQGSQILMNALK